MQGNAQTGREGNCQNGGCTRRERAGQSLSTWLCIVNAHKNANNVHALQNEMRVASRGSFSLAALFGMQTQQGKQTQQTSKASNASKRSSSSTTSIKNAHKHAHDVHALHSEIIFPNRSKCGQSIVNPGRFSKPRNTRTPRLKGRRFSHPWRFSSRVRSAGSPARLCSPSTFAS